MAHRGRGRHYRLGDCFISCKQETRMRKESHFGSPVAVVAGVSVGAHFAKVQQFGVQSRLVIHWMSSGKCRLARSQVRSRLAFDQVMLKTGLGMF